MGCVCFLFISDSGCFCCLGKGGILCFLLSLLISEGVNPAGRAATVISIQVSFKFIFNRWVLKKHS